MIYYTCDQMQRIRKSDDVPDVTTAAWIFATRLAFRQYGRGGICRTLRADHWTQDGSYHCFEAFIGRPVRGNPSTTSGRNVWLDINVKELP